VAAAAGRPNGRRQVAAAADLAVAAAGTQTHPAGVPRQVTAAGNLRETAERYTAGRQQTQKRRTQAGRQVAGNGNLIWQV